MVLGITQGRTRKCKDSLGGLDKVYIFKHVNYSRSQITLNGNILESYPSTIIYEIEFNTNLSFDERQSENEGGKYYDINFALVLPKNLGIEFEYLTKFDVNFIIKDRLGNYRFLGNRNGLSLTNFSYNTGGGKSDFNGVNMTFEGQEERGAWYIEDLESAGFTIAGDFEYLLQENGDFILQENGDKIIL